jgi:hypothetical protein
MTALLALAVIAPFDATSLLDEAAKHYGGLKRYEATVEHHNDSGLFPGDYTQKLVWTGKGKFTLKVTKGAKPEGPRGTAPDYTADGTRVKSVHPNGTLSEETVTPRPNSSPGWEVSGGLILSFLEQTELSKMIRQGTEKIAMTWTMGKVTKWQNLPVRELIGSFNKKASVHVFLEAKSPRIVGLSNPTGGWMIYRSPKEN